MTVSELRALHQQHRFKEAEIMHDIVSPAGSWSSGAGRPPLRDDGHPGVPHELSSTEEARDHIHLVADCPVQVEHLYRFFER
jgi:hypothetical protein